MTRPATKRNDILRVAMALFAEKGIRGTTIREIAAAAGVTEGALYRHFDSKHDLAVYLFAAGANLLYDHLEAAMAGIEAAPARVRALICALFDFADKHPEVLAYVMSRHYETAGEAPATHRLPKTLFAATVGEGMARREFREMNPDLAAAMVIGACLQSIMFHRQGMLPGAPEAVRCEVCTGVLRLLGASE